MRESFGLISWRAALYFLVAILPIPGTALYFPQPNLQVAHFAYETQMTVRAILDPDDAGTVYYNISSQPTAAPCLHLEVVNGHGGEGTGTIFYRQELLPVADGSDPWTCTYGVTGSLEGQVGGRGRPTAQINITLLQTPQLCTNALRCWGGALEYNFTVLENSDELAVGSLGSAYPGILSSPCDQSSADVTYDLSMSIPNQRVVFLTEGEGGDFVTSVRVKGGLDREFRDEYLFTISCTVREVVSGSTVAETLVLPGALHVLDQNDNGPTTQEGTLRANVSVSLKHILNKYEPHTRLVQDHPVTLLFRDLDTKDVNSYELTLHDDWKGLLNVTFLATQVQIPGATKPPDTAILPNIHLSSRIHDIEPWPGLYCVEATFTDISIIPSLENQATLEYRICIHWSKNSSALWENAEWEGRGIRRLSNISRIEGVPYSSVLSPGTLEGAVCNDLCLFIVSGLGASFIAIFVLIVYLFKTRVSLKKKNRGGGRLNLLNGGGEGPGDHSGMSMMILGSETDYMRHGLGTPRGHPFTPEIEIMIDSKWEIPRKALILENSIGTGQFGQVYRARTDAIPGREGIFMEVAVKMLKDNQNEGGKSCRQEFLSEFSLLQQLDHPNVIKVLGVCTAAGGPLYLVMDFAEYGSLRGFLRKCRRIESFETGTNLESGNSEATLPSTPTPSEQRDFVVTPHEILQFSWQIAKGMTYLSDMKMVHRDLAARNILLTKDKVCKISDFGLTRDIYVEEAYQKKSRGPVPVKWLAPESLADEVYTKKSDVWSYGVLLWELATLGASPYPGIPAEELYSLLKGGYRMAPPPNTSSQFYAIMRDCWAHEPWNRPTFRSIQISIGKLLEDGIEYLKLDLPLVTNPGYNYFSTTNDEFQPFTYESQTTGSIPPSGRYGVHTYMNSATTPPSELYPKLEFDATAYETPIGQLSPLTTSPSPLLVQN